MPTSRHSDFHTTCWTLILSANNSHPSSSQRRPLEHLARSYWYPLYAYIRRRGHAAPEAEDLTQDFFADLLQRHAIANVDPAKGRFRAFLLASLKNFLLNHYDKQNTQKRGGQKTILTLDAAESRYTLEPVSTEESPERLFERRWALAILDRVLAQLESDYTARNEQELFAALKPTLTSLAHAASHAAIAKNLHSTPGAIKVAAHRLRRRYRDLLRSEIAHTVATEEEIDDEITYLLNCL